MTLLILLILNQLLLYTAAIISCILLYLHGICISSATSGRSKSY